MRKTTRQYYFSVEGETEKLYLAWLQNLINKQDERKFNVVFKAEVCRPKSYVKRLKTLESVEVYNVIDFESQSVHHVNEFKAQIDEMVEVVKLNGNKIKRYQLAYTNLSFELWMLLHVTACNAPKNSKHDYLPLINKHFNKEYQSLREYKRGNEFKNILTKLTLDDVMLAIKRAYIIEDNNLKHQKQNYRNHVFHLGNPSLSLHEILNDIFTKIGFHSE